MSRQAQVSDAKRPRAEDSEAVLPCATATVQTIPVRSAWSRRRRKLKGQLTSHLEMPEKKTPLFQCPSFVTRACLGKRPFFIGNLHQKRKGIFSPCAVGPSSCRWWTLAAVHRCPRPCTVPKAATREIHSVESFLCTHDMQRQRQTHRGMASTWTLLLASYQP